MKYFTGTK